MRHTKMFLYSLFFIGGMAVWNVGLCVDTIQVVFNFLTRNHKGQDPYYTTKDCLRYTGPYTEEPSIGDETTLYPPSQSHYFLFHRIRVAPDMWLDSKCAFGMPAVAYRRCNIRTKPSTEGKIVGKTNFDDTYYVSMKWEGNWAIVYHKGSARYVWDDCLAI